MSKNMTWKPMPINGVGIRMSACGHTFVPAARTAVPAMGAFTGYAATGAVETKGHVSLLVDGDVRVQARTKAEATGTDAWRPPTT